MKYLILIFSFLISSCSHLQSGQYIQLGENDSFKNLSKKFKVPVWKIKEANEGKEFVVGKWFFIPLERGVGQIFKDSRDYTPGSVKRYTKDFIWPVPSCKKISSSFGKRWGRQHQGIDIPAKEGAHFISVADGVVVYSGDDLSGYGNLTVVSHRGGVFSIYAHAQKNYTSKGDKVFKGQVLGKVGETGRATGPHLHFEIRRDSIALNPSEFFVVH